MCVEWCVGLCVCGGGFEDVPFCDVCTCAVDTRCVCVCGGYYVCVRVYGGHDVCVWWYDVCVCVCCVSRPTGAAPHLIVVVAGGVASAFATALKRSSEAYCLSSSSATPASKTALCGHSPRDSIGEAERKRE